MIEILQVNFKWKDTAFTGHDIIVFEAGMGANKVTCNLEKKN